MSDIEKIVSKINRLQEDNKNHRLQIKQNNTANAMYRELIDKNQNEAYKLMQELVTAVGVKPYEDDYGWL